MFDLQAAFNTMKGNVAENFKGDWCPMVVGYNADGIIPILMPWHTSVEKLVCIDVTRMQFKVMGVFAYAASFECWMARETPTADWPGNDQFKPPSGMMPRDRPDRKEIMFIIAESISGESMGGYWNIGRRGKRAFVTTFTSMSDGDKSFETSLLTNMFGRSLLH